MVKFNTYLFLRFSDFWNHYEGASHCYQDKGAALKEDAPLNVISDITFEPGKSIRIFLPPFDVRNELKLPDVRFQSIRWISD